MRYALEVSYKGTNYAGFQIQQNAVTIQSEVEKALDVVFRSRIPLTGSSRTDAGVHAYSNYFHFDVDFAITNRAIYSLNSLLPVDISVKRILAVADTFHSRFDAVSRKYQYNLHNLKDPFLTGISWFYPYQLDKQLLSDASALLYEVANFESFSKKNTQVFTHNCTIIHSQWHFNTSRIWYEVQANRFLRGMVRALVGTMLQVGRGKISLEEFKKVISNQDNTKADFSTPAHGLFLMEVNYPGTRYL